MMILHHYSITYYSIYNFNLEDPPGSLIMLK